MINNSEDLEKYLSEHHDLSYKLRQRLEDMLIGIKTMEKNLNQVAVENQILEEKIKNYVGSSETIKQMIDTKHDRLIKNKYNINLSIKKLCNRVNNLLNGFTEEQKQIVTEINQLLADHVQFQMLSGLIDSFEENQQSIKEDFFNNYKDAKEANLQKEFVLEYLGVSS